MGWQEKKRGCYSGAPLLSTYVILHVTALFGQNTTLHTLYLHSTYTHETSLSNFQISHGSKPMTLKTGLLAQFFTLNKKTPTKKANSSSFRSKKLKSLKPESAAPRRKRTALFYLKEKKRKTRRRRRIQWFSSLPGPEAFHALSLCACLTASNCASNATNSVSRADNTAEISNFEKLTKNAQSH